MIVDFVEFLFENYAKAKENIAALRGRGCSIIHELDATTMASRRYLDGMKFDRIVFNFPFAGFFKESRASQIQLVKLYINILIVSRGTVTLAILTYVTRGSNNDMHG
ncbi:Heavy metal-associated isoprenylated plant protein 41 [Linum grandiflorum]